MQLLVRDQFRIVLRLHDPFWRSGSLSFRNLQENGGVCAIGKRRESEFWIVGHLFSTKSLSKNWTKIVHFPEMKFRQNLTGPPPRVQPVSNESPKKFRQNFACPKKPISSKSRKMAKKFHIFRFQISPIPFLNFAISVFEFRHF